MEGLPNQKGDPKLEQQEENTGPCKALSSRKDRVRKHLKETRGYCKADHSILIASNTSKETWRERASWWLLSRCTNLRRLVSFHNNGVEAGSQRKRKLVCTLESNN